MVKIYTGKWYKKYKSNNYALFFTPSLNTYFIINNELLSYMQKY